MSNSRARNKGHKKKKRVNAGIRKYWKERGYVCLDRPRPCQIPHPPKTQFWCTLLKQFWWKRTAPKWQVREFGKCISYTKLQAQSTPTCVEPTRNDEIGWKFCVRSKSNAQSVWPAEERKEIRAPNLQQYSYQLACHYLIRKLIKKSRLSSAAVETDKRIEPRIRQQGASPARSIGESAATARSRDGIEPPQIVLRTDLPPTQQPSKEARRGGILPNIWRECTRPVYATTRGNGARKQRQARQAKGQEQEQATWGGWGEGGLPRRRRRSCPRPRRAPSWPATWWSPARTHLEPWARSQATSSA
jgi:hypothetical protein